MSPLLLLITLLPTAALLLFIYLMDSFEKEPIRLLLLLFALGAAGIIPAVIHEFVFGAINDVFFSEGSFPYNFVDNFLIVAVAEEGVKFLVLMLIAWRNKNFNYRFDGIVYAVFVSLGFATLENILYVIDGGFSTAVMRALLAVPSHAIDAVFMGLHLGNARFFKAAGNRKQMKVQLLLAYLVPVLTHGFYDFCLSYDSTLLIILFILYVIGIDVLAFFMVLRASRHNTLIQPAAAPGPQKAPGAGENPGNPVPKIIIPQSSVPEFVYCTQCGKKSSSRAFYCTQCGTALHHYN